ncbi:FkbM family methyltransferase [Devosia sp.]|uniref:FkbM family methyltransferase n=1 Tax=Devosia sp. TaxID=1871048 RepID=UPI0032667696
MELTPDHKLPEYQQSHRLYDKFLPVLVQHMGKGIVVDVGANCGDSLASMLSLNSQLHYVCVEADAAFFQYLTRNVEKMRQARPDASVSLVNAMAGPAGKSGVMEGIGGTKTAVAAADSAHSMTTTPLDDLAELATEQRVVLIKVDTDGHDFEVIQSAGNILAKHSPMIHFECYLPDAQTHQNYVAAIKELFDDGYKTWYVFDNFGYLLIATSDLAVVNALIDYSYLQNAAPDGGAIQYLDFLCCRWAQDQAIADAAVADYMATIRRGNFAH